MKTSENCTAIKPEVLTDHYLESTINRTATQAKQGYINKTQVSKLLNRSRRTLHDWDQMLTSILDDWAKLQKTRQYNFYQYYCLKKLSQYQNITTPFKSLDDLISYVKRNIDSFTLESYFNQF